MDEFPAHQTDVGGCLVKLIVLVFMMGLLGILVLGIVTGIVFARGVLSI